MVTLMTKTLPNHSQKHLIIPNHSQKHTAVCGLSFHLDNTERCKNMEQKFIFQIGTLRPNGINKCIFTPLI